MRRALLVAGVAAGVGWLGLLLGFLLEPRRTLFAYLAMYGFGLSTAVGALILVMSAWSIRARWFVVLRRLAEAPMATLPVFVLLLLPLLVGAGTLYPWAGSLEQFPAEERQLVAAKGAWFSVPFFAARCLVYLAALAGLATVLARGSLRQDRAASPEAALDLDRRLQAVSAGGLPAVALIFTFACFDLWMSLEPAWFSTVYGVYVFAGGFVAALALVAVLSAAFRARGKLPEEVAASHHHALGKLLLSFVIFWGYIAFVQFLLIWIADLPREVGFYLRRTEGSWKAVTWALALGHFVVPFAVLLSRDLKRRPKRLALVAVWILAFHLVDFVWLVLPVRDPGYVLHPVDLVAFLAIAGTASLAGLLAYRGRATVPVGAPDLGGSLEYRTR